MTFEELLHFAGGIYEESDFPVIVTDDGLEMQWANNVALRRFPSLKYKSGVQEMLADYDVPQVLALLKSGKAFVSQSMQSPLNVSRFSVIPAMSGGRLIGCIFAFDIQGEDSGLVRTSRQKSVVTSFTDGYKLPLTIIFSTLGLMARNPSQSDETQKTYIKLISQNCYRLLRMLNNISELVLFNSGIPVMEMRRGDLTAFIRGLCDAVGVMTSAVDIPLDIDIPDKEVFTVFDPVKLSTAILNIVSNSCKYTRSGNTIKIKLEVMDNQAVVTISDRGAGIEKEILGRIFEPYFSHQPEGDSRSCGGLGLTIAKQIIALHGGTIAVESRKSEGTRVAFALPLKPDDNAPDYTAESGVDYLADRFSTLYVELSDVCGTPMP